MNNPIIIDSTDRLHLEVDRGLRIKEASIETFQDIPSSFLDRIQDTRTLQDGKFAADDVKVAELPGAVVDHWFRQGFNIWDPNVKPQDIIDRLMREDLSKFICTSMTFG